MTSCGIILRDNIALSTPKANGLNTYYYIYCYTDPQILNGAAPKYDFIYNMSITYSHPLLI